MKKRRLVAIIFGILAIGWLGVLFFFSGQNGVDSSSLSLELARRIARRFPELGMGPRDLEPILRKIAHFGIFAVEGLFAGTSLIYDLGFGRGMASSLVLCALVAVANELHQLLSDGRSCEVRDMLIDSGGALTGVIVSATAIAIIGQISKRKAKYGSRTSRRAADH